MVESTVHARVQALEAELGTLRKRDLRYVFTRGTGDEKEYLCREVSRWVDDPRYPGVARVRSEKTATKRLAQFLVRGKMTSEQVNEIGIEIVDITL